MTTDTNISIGSTVWFEHCHYDYRANSTVYDIREAEVTGETPRKWVAKQTNSWREWSFPKTGGTVRVGKGKKAGEVTLYMTRAALEEAQAARELARWVQIHAAKVGAQVQQIRNADLLRTVAVVIGYEFTPPDAKEGV